VTETALFADPVSGPAYGRTFRLFATLAVLALLAYGVRVVFVLLPEPPSREGWIVLGASTIALIGTWYFMVTARTTIDAQGIRQSGLVERRTDWSEIWHARVRGPAFSRRLVVRNVGGRFRYFYGGTPELLAAFDVIAAAHPRKS
jgi:hypothetical protein